MAFIVEDGTGLATANAFCAVAVVDAFWADRGGADETTWLALGVGAPREKRIVLCTDFFRVHPRYRYRGQKKLATQRLPFPRTDCTERDGQAIADNIVPWQLVDAVCLLAPRMDTILRTLLPDLERGGMVTSEALVGVYSATYSDRAPIGKMIQYIDGLITPLLRMAGEMELLEAHVGVLVTPEVFDSEFFGSGAADDASAIPAET